MESRNVTESRELLPLAPLAFVIYFLTERCLMMLVEILPQRQERRQTLHFDSKFHVKHFKSHPRVLFTEWYFCPENVVSLWARCSSWEVASARRCWRSCQRHGCQVDDQ